nr:hypothetical protein [Streptomyces acidicola]
MSALPAAASADDAATAVPSWERTESDTWHDGRPRDARPHGGAALGAGLDGAPVNDPSDDFEGAGEGGPLAPQGRAARRRERAAWKKNKRRAVVATTVALIGGGLTLSTMERNSGDRAQAATAPELPRTDIGAEEPTAERTDPKSQGSDKRRSSPTPSQTPATNAPHEQSAAAPPYVAPQKVQSNTVTAPRTTLPLVPKPKPSSPSSGGSDSGQSSQSQSGTGTEAQTPTPTPSDNADSGSNSGSGSNSNSGSGSNSGTAPASPAPEATSPPKLCLLVICLGG